MSTVDRYLVLRSVNLTKNNKNYPIRSLIKIERELVCYQNGKLEAVQNIVRSQYLTFSDAAKKSSTRAKYLSFLAEASDSEL